MRQPQPEHLPHAVVVRPDTLFGGFPRCEVWTLGTWVLARALSLAAIISLTSVGFSSARDRSDWAEDARTAAYQPISVQQAETAMPPTAPDRSAPSPVSANAGHGGEHLEQGGFLTGSARINGTGLPPRPQVPTYSAIPSNPAAFNGNAAAFMMNQFAGRTEVVPPTSLRGWLESTHPEFNLSAQTNPAQVIEVKGTWDNAGEIMTAMGIRYQRVKAKALKEILSPATKVLVIDCEGKVPEDEWELVRQWVIRGGYLISTDWTLGNFLERAFPGTIAWNGSHTPGIVVDAEVVSHDPALLAGANVPRASWKLDDQSQEVKILRPDVVQVLARSYQLAERDRHAQFSNPNETGVVACTFAYGRGRVLHLVGHFDYNAGFGFMRYLLPDPIPGKGIGLRQAIATNFLIQGLERGGAGRVR